MNKIYNFINERKPELIQIYINERAARGDGIFTITIPTETSTEIKCVYIEDTQIPPELLSELQDKRINNSNNIIYFYLCAYDRDSAELLGIKL